jgi:type IV pilus assembly PilO-like protein
VTRRDRYILIVVGLVGLLGAYWMLALAPKRDRLGKLDKDVVAAKQSLEQSKQEKVQFAKAQVQFPQLYATLGRLGKAVPADEDVPSLLVQLNHAAAKANVDFRSVELKLDIAEKLAAAGGEAAAPAAPGSAGTTGAQGATGAAGATAAPATGGATAAPAATLQPLPFEYKFKGDFFHLGSLIHNVSRLVQSRNREVSISGRLVVIQGFSMTRGKVSIIATTYMLPADQGLFGGASPAGPAGGGATTPQPASATSATPTPPSAAVTP